MEQGWAGGGVVVLTFLTRSQMMHDPSAEALTHWRLSFVTCTHTTSSSSVHKSPPLCKAGPPRVCVCDAP